MSHKSQDIRPPGRRPRIVHVIPADGLGGVETAARSAAAAAGPDLDFTLYVMSGATLAGERDGIRDHPRRGPNNPLTYVRAVRDLLAAGPDVLVTSLWRALIVGIVVKLFRPATRWACFLHSTHPVHFADRIVQWLAIRLADELWADSAATLRVASRQSRKPGRSISFVTQRPQALSRPAPALSFVNWSRLERIKGHDRALALIGLLADRGDDPHFVIWGPDAGDGARLAAQAERLALSDRVRFAGPATPGQIDAIARGHMFYLGLSHQEGMGMSVIEAMQRGLIPVVTRVGAIGDYVRDGVNGVLVDPADLGAAADRLSALVRSPATLERMARAAANEWQEWPLYADDFFAAAMSLAQGPAPQAPADRQISRSSSGRG